MGPFAMADMAGLDIGWSVRKAQAPTRPRHLRYSPIADRICEMGRFGQKTGAGWYRYEKGDRTPIPDPEIAKLVAAVSKELGIERRTIGHDEIVERCIYAMVNEGAKILEEGIAMRSSDVDIVWIYGYGFPRYRGGPMFYADTVGARQSLRSRRPLPRTAGRVDEAISAPRAPREGREHLHGNGVQVAEDEKPRGFGDVSERRIPWPHFLSLRLSIPPRSSGAGEAQR